MNFIFNVKEFSNPCGNFEINQFVHFAEFRCIQILLSFVGRVNGLTRDLYTYGKLKCQMRNDNTQRVTLEIICVCHTCSYKSNFSSSKSQIKKLLLSLGRYLMSIEHVRIFARLFGDSFWVCYSFV